MAIPDREHPWCVGVIGGSGLASLSGLQDLSEEKIDTPYGSPSAAVVSGQIEGRTICFLARHGPHHTILPTEVNHRANIWALRSKGVRWIICVNAVGSLQERYAPRSVVLIDQFYDRSSQRAQHTFFGQGVVAHIAFADPISEDLRSVLLRAAREEDADAHDGGTYVCIDGPAFSTRAECAVNRAHGFDVVGMTNLPEAKLAREAGIALATLAFVTDYDCWKDEAVTADAVADHLSANADLARRIIGRALPEIPRSLDAPEHHALQEALFTPRSRWTAKHHERLDLFFPEEDDSSLP